MIYTWKLEALVPKILREMIRCVIYTILVDTYSNAIELVMRIISSFALHFNRWSRWLRPWPALTLRSWRPVPTRGGGRSVWRQRRDRLDMIFLVNFAEDLTLIGHYLIYLSLSSGHPKLYFLQLLVLTLGSVVKTGCYKLLYMYLSRKWIDIHLFILQIQSCYIFFWRGKAQ